MRLTIQINPDLMLIQDGDFDLNYRDDGSLSVLSYDGNMIGHVIAEYAPCCWMYATLTGDDGKLEEGADK